ncbi:uncharacterized protein MYU51_014615 [Penicillium brevicompactum]|uniref:uncharacterized protein n=1 Tax=Penicillium brevicompactum TaxID=5074 RepID=UPI0025414A19|nr:uncharacterized protein N7506_009678 [Penicillium brevicompactum]KAJ5326576.1 hypothetical protein N7506_009678 [Penicillium brevicompactum]
MKLGLAITSLFAASATAAKYAAGQDCRTNKGCDQNCLGGKWSVAIVAGDARLVCDPGNLDSTRYASAGCIREDGEVEGEGRAIIKASEVACDSAKGKFCGHSCYFTTKASLEQDMTTNFQKKCQAQGDRSHPYTGSVFFYPSKDLAAPYSSCKSSDVFP